LEETLPVFEKTAVEKKAPLIIASQKRHVLGWKWEKHQLIVEVAEVHNTDHKFYHLDLPGLYQAKNLLTVLEACTQLQLKGYDIGHKAELEGLKYSKKETGLHGRWEIIKHSPLIVLDVAHNEDGVKQVLEQVEVTDHNELHVILGMVKDKEIDSVLKLFPKTAHYYFTQAQIPRALPTESLYNKAAAHGLIGKSYPDVNTALNEAKLKADPKDMILVCGSVFLVAEVNY
jgi:dihydrofolate synthase/folylpolyglutamate synthase